MTEVVEMFKVEGEVATSRTVVTEGLGAVSV
jgi:hypothetical protein